MHIRKFNSIPLLAFGWLVLLSLIAIGISNRLCAQSLKVGANAGGAPSDLPLSFEPNNGQSDDKVRFVARGPGYTMYLNEAGASIQFSRPLGVSANRKQPVLALKLAGRKKTSPKLLGQGETPSTSSYFIGSDPKKWLTGIPNFSQVGLREVYDGVDVTYHGRHGELQCEFKVSPHANPASIALEIAGASNLRLDPQGDLIFTAAQTEMRLQKPFAFQEENDSRQTVAVRYILNKNRVTFGLGHYDAGRPLFVNPVLRYSGYLKLQEADSLPAQGSESDAAQRGRAKSSVPSDPGARRLHLAVPQGSCQLSKSGWLPSGMQPVPVTAQSQYPSYRRETTMSFLGPQIREFYLEKNPHDTIP